VKENRDIEWLVNWAFQVQRVEAALRNVTPDAPAISPSAMLQMLELGCRVDTSSSAQKWDSARCGDDAVVIYDCVRRLPREAVGLVVMHGRAGTRPDWCPEGVGCEVPVLTAKGKPRRIYRDPIKCRGDLGPMMRWQGHRPEVVEFHRAQYRVWHLALNALVLPLNEGLGDYVATKLVKNGWPWDWSVQRRVVHAG